MVLIEQVQRMVSLSIELPNTHVSLMDSKQHLNAIATISGSLQAITKHTHINSTWVINEYWFVTIKLLYLKWFTYKQDLDICWLINKKYQDKWGLEQIYEVG